MDVASEQLGELSMRYVCNRPDLGTTPGQGFDCSGFVTFVLTHAGLSVPDYIGQDNQQRPIRHANEYWDQYGVAIHPAFRQPGDLIFFSRHGDFPHHIGIVRDEESYIHAPGKDHTRVCVEGIEEQYITPEKLERAVGRPLYAVNPIGYKSPSIPKRDATYRYHQTII